MKYLLIILFFILMGLLQVTIISQLLVGEIVVNLVLISIIFFNIFKKLKKYGIWASLAGGLTLDLFSTLPFGVITLSFILITFFIQRFSNIFKKITILPIVLSVGLMVVTYNFLLVTLVKIQNFIPIFKWYQIDYLSLRHFLGIEIVYSIGVTILFYFILELVCKLKNVFSKKKI